MQLTALTDWYADHADPAFGRDKWFENPVGTMTKPKHNRRGFLAGIAAVFGISSATRVASAAGLTPSAAEGPFYPTGSMRLPDVDNDLVKVLGRVKQAGGEVVLLKGQITGNDGKPKAGYRIEIWQCDLNGKYLHPGDNRDVDFDHSFQGFGHDITDTQGRYSFRTIKPGKYPGRTPHIHVKVLHEGREILTTQFYIAGNHENRQDSLYRRLSKAEARSVSMQFTNAAGVLETTVNLVV